MDGWIRKWWGFQNEIQLAGQSVRGTTNEFTLSRTRIAGIERNSAIGSSAMCPIQTFLSKDNKIHLHVGYQRYIAHKDFVLF